MSERAEHGDREIPGAWSANARAWTEAVRQGRIPSRQRVTNAAILEAIFDRQTTRLLDVGCGEGWLARAVAARGVSVLGIDAVAALVREAQAAGGGEFAVMDHRALADEGLEERFDAIVCNFSLLGDADTRAVIGAAPALLAAGGRLLIQTLHPVVACGEFTYADGWRDGSWDGIEGDFEAAAPWFFRTLESWVRLIASSGLRLERVLEPVDPASGLPASVIFVASAL